jgi:hypothetical protein
MTGVQRATARTRRTRYVQWTGSLTGFPDEWLERLTPLADGILRVQTKRGPILTHPTSYILEGERGIYPAPKGVAEYNYDLRADGWATRRPTEVEFVPWTGRFEDLPDTWRMHGAFSFSLAGRLVVQSLEGRLMAEDDDRIIRGPFGEFYPSSLDTFRRNYHVQRAVAHA